MILKLICPDKSPTVAVNILFCPYIPAKLVIVPDQTNPALISTMEPSKKATFDGSIVMTGDSYTALSNVSCKVDDKSWIKYGGDNWISIVVGGGIFIEKFIVSSMLYGVVILKRKLQSVL